MEDWKQADTDPLGFLVAPMGAETFLETVWEKEPNVFKATPERKALFNQLFTFGALHQLAEELEEEGEPLLFGEDVNAARYVDGERETPNEEVADAGTIKQLFLEGGCTMQLHQPQRYVDPLWRLMAAMERQLGCLVGCNAYLTPKDMQGLAPHYDDVEIFVAQAEGSKRWCLYRPQEGALAGGLLANHCSGDLDESELGEPVLDVTLEVGDVLYMPRGTVHQARALGAHSTHLTLSTYQRWAVGDLMQYAISVGLANPQLQTLLPPAVRAGLPLCWLGAAGFGAADVPPAVREQQALLAAFEAGTRGRAPGAKAGGGSAGAALEAGAARGQLQVQLAAAFRTMADWLEDKSDGAQGGQGVLRAAADAMGEDFMRSRLPPHPEQLAERGLPPTATDRVACRGDGFFRLVLLKEGDEPEGSESEGEESDDELEMLAGPKWVVLVSCLENDRSKHMMPGSFEADDEAGGEGGCCEVPGCHDHSHHHHHHAGEDSEREGGDEEEEGSGSEGEGAAAHDAGRKRARGPEAGAGSESSSGEEGSSEDEDEDEVEDAVFPIQFAPALLQLLGSSVEGGGVAVEDIPLPGPHLRLDLAEALWHMGVLATLPPAAAAAAPKRDKRQQPGKKAAAGKAEQEAGAGKGKKRGQGGGQQGGKKKAKA